MGVEEKRGRSRGVCKDPYVDSLRNIVDTYIYIYTAISFRTRWVRVYNAAGVFHKRVTPSGSGIS